MRAGDPVIVYRVHGFGDEVKISSLTLQFTGTLVRKYDVDRILGEQCHILADGVPLESLVEGFVFDYDGYATTVERALIVYIEHNQWLSGHLQIREAAAKALLEERAWDLT